MLAYLTSCRVRREQLEARSWSDYLRLDDGFAAPFRRAMRDWPQILVGMKATMSHLLHYKPVTVQYPHEKRTLPDNYRGMLGLLRYDDGTEKCVGCDLCEAACPSRVIHVVSAERPSKPSSPLSTPSQASWTTSSATARLET